MERPTHAGLRHVALNVRALDAMKRFYVDLLGFAVEWEPDADNIYLSSGIDNLALHRSTEHAGNRSGELTGEWAVDGTLDHAAVGPRAVGQHRAGERPDHRLEDDPVEGGQEAEQRHRRSLAELSSRP